MAHACIFGMQGPTLSRVERAFFRDVDPWGFILFKRNIETPEQVKALTASLRDCIGRADAPILIDQEGGRVQRMGPPHWRLYPPGRAFGLIRVNDPLYRREIARLGGRLLANDLLEVGINVDCAPVLDVPTPGSHDVIGNRAYGEDADTVSILGRAVAEGLIAGGVLPVIKHIPGHGRSSADSHLSLPIVDAWFDDLNTQDFQPFRVLADMPMAMTAHVVYTAIDRTAPATTSKKVVRNIIRRSIGFGGLLMTDDLSMKALGGSFADRTTKALAAGCDIALHCNGDMSEMKAVAKGAKPLRGRAKRRADVALARIAKVPEPFDAAEGWARFEAALA